MHCRVRYLLDFYLKIRSCQVCLGDLVVLEKSWGNIFNDYIFEISRFHWSKCTVECAIYSILNLKSLHTSSCWCSLWMPLSWCNLPGANIYTWTIFTLDSYVVIFFWRVTNLRGPSWWQMNISPDILDMVCQKTIFTSMISLLGLKLSILVFCSYP